MRTSLLLLALFAFAAPAAAQPAPRHEPVEIPRELTDPAMAERLGDMMEVLTDALLEMPVGEIQAAAEGRKPTAQEKGLTVRDIGRRDDPNFERNMKRQVAQAKPMMRQTMKAFAAALPAMTKALSEAAIQMERAVENMPRTDYPRR